MKLAASTFCALLALLTSTNATPVKPAPPSLEELSAARASFDKRVASRVQLVARSAPTGYISDDPNGSLWQQFHEDGTLPEPIRNNTGATSIGPENVEVDRQNPDIYAPPSTDHGSIPQAKWPFALSHNRLEEGGWARQQNVDVLPVATEIAGVNMRLEEGAYRELHWHTSAEWAYILNGTMRVTSVDNEGRNFVGDLGEGDLWYFPSGFPHSLQATSKGGAEFLLVFDDGHFSEDSTLLLTDWTAHIPREVILKNFDGVLNNTALNKFPDSELYIFPSDAPNNTASDDLKQIANPQGAVPNAFTYQFSKVEPVKLAGGSVKIADSRNFTASKTIAAAEVVIEPGAMRELHWHPNSPEWDFFISGEARMTIFAGQSNARTYNFIAGDTAYLGQSQGHYIENIGTEPLRYLEIFKAPQYQDVSLSTWLAVTPASVIQAHLGFSDAEIRALQGAFKTNNHQVVGAGFSNGGKSKRDAGEVAEGLKLIAGKRSWY